MKKKIIIICLTITLLATGCSANTGNNIEKVKPSATTQATAEVSTAPILEPTQQPTEESIQECNFSYIDEVTLEEPFDTLFINGWNTTEGTKPFATNEDTYTKGLGMYIDSDLIMDKQASLTAVWNVEKKYNKITFDLGCEKSMNYDVANKFGEFQIVIMTDGKVAWESAWQDYNYSEKLNFTIGEDCERLEIRLKQRKGSEGTLKVVLGNLKLYKNEE